MKLIKTPSHTVHAPGPDKGGHGRVGRRIGRVLIALFAAIALAIAAAAVYVYAELQPVASASKPVRVTVPTGSSVREIGQLLEQNGLVRNGLVFAYYVKAKGLGNRLQAGDYQFRPGESPLTIINRLVDGDVTSDVVRVTIPEGWNVEQIAALLEKKQLVSQQAFLREVNEGAFPEFPFVASIPKKEGRKYRLEGYLFPETYEVKKGASAHEIIAKMLAQFQKVWRPQWDQELKARKMSMDDAVTLASIIEREVVVDKERPIVAGVYYNRLREGWLLQADATVQFVLGKQRERLTYDDLKVNSPYNTYLHPGLPPGPIANPGQASLQAAVKPAHHDFFFYVTKKDGSSEHYFSKTLQEHMAQDAKSRKQ